MRVLLEPGAAPDLWRLRLDALAPAADVALSLRADTGSPRLVWRGAVTAGDMRSFEVRLAMPAGAGAIRAEAEVLGAAPAVLRATAVIPLASGKPVAAVAGAAQGAGRLVTDPQSGETVLELPSSSGRP